MEILPVTGLPMGQVPADVLVCGDPARASQIAKHLEDAQLLSERREYRCYLGHYEGLSVAACSHGVGAPGAAPAFEELIAAGARRLIRVGTCGSLQPHLGSGALIVATAAVQSTGYGREIVPPGFPAVADLDLTQALRRATALLGREAASGIVLTRDSFYRGLELPTNPNYKRLSGAQVLAVEMECAALFLVGTLRDIPTAAVLTVDGIVLDSPETMEGYQPGRQVVLNGVNDAIEVALKALRLTNHAHTE